MSYVDSNSLVIAAADTGTTIAGILFWVVLVAAYTALILFTLWKVIHSGLEDRARTLWVWLVVLAPLVGIIAWFTVGRPSPQAHPNTDHT
ncbi:PLD nuclease N-terminal domain-containing protein [Plantactinospora endophytica]|uniref:Cardiolipin synthase N-terminal domain-containing protein n=1 Tax=Plantactinospora endophytica TaxID=673535 RepID=A0ABQ4E6N8_9ACTN|nr:PLD nuclease N-terminal domain-containing protein [Plantactinospora endophytica]GIG90351.1 hypothetical protein Pen02_52870 [Plantactinospora endophytica]